MSVTRTDALDFQAKVIDPALKAIGFYSAGFSQLLLGTAIQESGLVWRQQMNGGPALGLFQCEPETYEDIRVNYLAYNPALKQSILSLTGTPDLPAASALMTNDMFAAAICACHYKRHRVEVNVGDIPGMAQVWKQWYNTALGQGTTEEFIEAWNHMMNPNPAGVPVQPQAPAPKPLPKTSTTVITSAATTVVGVPTLMDYIDYFAQVLHLNPMPSPVLEAGLASAIVAVAHGILLYWLYGKAGIQKELGGNDAT